MTDIENLREIVFPEQSHCILVFNMPNTIDIPLRYVAIGMLRIIKDVPHITPFYICRHVIVEPDVGGFSLAVRESAYGAVFHVQHYGVLCRGGDAAYK